MWEGMAHLEAEVLSENMTKANDIAVSIDVPCKIHIDVANDPVTSIIDFTYPNILDNIIDLSYFQEKAILAPTNEVVDTINDHLLEKFTNALLKL
ncbi:ATP-dependent DNA helicase PIF1-like protein [Tanacetum coccineum]